ncbi:Nn.00g043280.m01.CDS01 [Neocucurbitaria sp. VM-36]
MSPNGRRLYAVSSDQRRGIAAVDNMSHSSTSPVRRRNNDVEWTPLPEIDTSTEFDTIASGLPSEGVEESDSFLSGTAVHRTVNHDFVEPRALHSQYDAAHERIGTTEDHIGRTSVSLSSDQRLSGDHVSPEVDQDLHLSPPAMHDSNNTHAAWLPYTLRPYFLSILALVSLILSIVLAVLCSQSVRNNGLGKDDGSTGLIVGWQYVPTLIAVFFAQAMVMILEDVKRTEPFARLARPYAVPAKFTLLYVPQVWWKVFSEGFSKKKSAGRISWMLLSSSLAVGISLLVISPLSSSVFVAEEVVIQREGILQRYGFDQSKTMSLAPRRDTYLHTISGYLYNTSASEWVSDDHIVFPFKAGEPSYPLGQFQQSVWKAETTIMQLESNCTSMSVMRGTSFNVSYVYGVQQQVTSQVLRNMTSNSTMACSDVKKLMKSDTTPSNSSEAEAMSFGRGNWINCTQPFVENTIGLILQAEDDCTIQLQSPFLYEYLIQTPSSQEELQMDWMTRTGGALWTNLSSSYSTWLDFERQHGDPPFLGVVTELSTTYDEWAAIGSYIYSMSEKCRGRDLILVTSPWYDNWRNTTQLRFTSNFSARAELCTPTYYAATMPVVLSSSAGKSNVSFDENEFVNRRKPVSKSMFNIDALNHFAFRDSWQKYTTASENADLQGLRGASRVLSELFLKDLPRNNSGSDKTAMLHNNTLSAQASRLRSRFFGELMLSSLMEENAAVMENVTGQVTIVEQRIVVVPEIAITLAVLFGLIAFYIAAMLWYASNRRRPLGLGTDPATTVGTASLLIMNSSLALSLRALRSGQTSDIWSPIRSRSYVLRDRILSEQPQTEQKYTESKSSKQKRNDWRPSMLHKRWLTTYLFGLLLVAIILLVLRGLASKNRLTQSFFLYEADWNLFHMSFSPSSIIATLVAVGISLYWGGIDKPMRTLQPYLAMSRSPARMSQGANLSYQSAFWGWAAVKAALSRHWLLCLIAIGTTLCQVLVISMAAIFESQGTFKTQSYSIDRTWINRQQPFQYTTSIYPWFYLNDEILNTTRSDWLYTALNEITLQTASPAWTRDGWAFTPVDMQQLLIINSDQKTENTVNNNTVSNFVASSANVSFATTALRGRLECAPILPARSNWTSRIEKAHTSDRIGNLTGIILPTLLGMSQMNNTPIFSAPRQMACCTNGTDGGQSVVAYWSSNNSYIDEEQPWSTIPYEDGWVRNFTVKWIVGSGKTAEVSGQRDLSTSPNVVMADGSRPAGNVTLLYYEEQPHIQIMNCEPVLETANARITVDRSSGQVLESMIIDEPKVASDAWNTVYDMGDITDCSKKSCLNVTGTVSYGHYFLSQMLTAAHIITPPVDLSDMITAKYLENVASERFNIRDLDNGLNMDFMSYANYILADKDPTALLDADTLREHSQRTFQTFFQHFVTSARWDDQRAAYEAVDARSVEKVDVIVSTRMKVLSMNETATWLSLAIIFLLVIILVVLMVSLEHVYPRSSMQRSIECLADILLMVAGSDNFVSLVHGNGFENLKKSTVKTRLGWFKDKMGFVRWGIEVEDAVEWVDDPGNQFTGELAKNVVVNLGKGHVQYDTDSTRTL